MTGIFLAGLLGVMVGAAIAVACSLAAGRIHRKSRLQRMKVCPMCSGSAESFTPGDTTDIRVETEPDAIMTCRRVISELPFEECNFSVPRSLLDSPWLRVRGVGTCNAGQTMWSAACFGLLEPFCSTTKLEVETIPCEAAEELGRTWDDVSLHRTYAKATMPSLSHPWLLQVRQAESRMKRLTVAISDCAGQIAQRSTHSVLYDHLLDAECHLFFVDPAKEEKDQLSVFHQFLVNVRGRRGLANSDRPIGPIAVCVPKCDLLSDSVARANQATRFIQQLRCFGPCDTATTLAAIRGRHELVVNHAGILPCIEKLTRRLQTDCGPDGFMFFPMTGVGWLPDGKPDASAYSLTDRSIVPWGVLDPLLWLIHASGFEALPA
ncbi:MAG: hypothetical protein NTY17_01680 [Planctomycetia bacterium]|nr:hypothetical protein [Planctomycetia bacterium]